jgi:hypothetical protein
MKTWSSKPSSSLPSFGFKSNLIAFFAGLLVSAYGSCAKDSELSNPSRSLDDGSSEGGGVAAGAAEP